MCIELYIYIYQKYVYTFILNHIYIYIKSYIYLYWNICTSPKFINSWWKESLCCCDGRRHLLFVFFWRLFPPQFSHIFPVNEILFFYGILLDIILWSLNIHIYIINNILWSLNIYIYNIIILSLNILLFCTCYQQEHGKMYLSLEIHFFELFSFTHLLLIGIR